MCTVSSKQLKRTMYLFCDSQRLLKGLISWALKSLAEKAFICFWKYFNCQIFDWGRYLIYFLCFHKGGRDSFFLLPPRDFQSFIRPYISLLFWCCVWDLSFKFYIQSKDLYKNSTHFLWSVFIIRSFFSNFYVEF